MSRRRGFFYLVPARIVHRSRPGCFPPRSCSWKGVACSLGLPAGCFERPGGAFALTEARACACVVYALLPRVLWKAKCASSWVFRTQSLGSDHSLTFGRTGVAPVEPSRDEGGGVNPILSDTKPVPTCHVKDCGRSSDNSIQLWWPGWIRTLHP